MGALRLSLALLFLLSSPVQAQWWSLFWASPKTSSSSSPPSVPPSITSPSITSPDPSDTPWTTELTGKEEGVTVPTPSLEVLISGHSTAEPGTLPLEENAGGGSKTRSQNKPLKYWRSGECYRRVEEKSH
ncbi:collagen, type XV, alpha 1b isoform X1 [Lates japonicus]|uniref:Collagen, type XV, alpha 1b isoform X1 n=1 Tax=Lates japonicus TaxID=270547 RepID=A0AAD3N4X6_LATJO|nr:collagen, type XV, alpha 1b isoform X1 [Lates japonicus]